MNIRTVLVSLGLLSMFASAAASAASVDIIQKDKKFDKASVTIKKGDTIVFKNQEKDITHNVYSLGPKNGFELKTQPPPPSKDSESAVVFKEAGETDVECAIHPGMKLKVKVE